MKCLTEGAVPADESKLTISSTDEDPTSSSRDSVGSEGVSNTNPNSTSPTDNSHPSGQIRYTSTRYINEVFLSAETTLNDINEYNTVLA